MAIREGGGVGKNADVELCNVEWRTSSGGISGGGVRSSVGFEAKIKCRRSLSRELSGSWAAARQSRNCATQLAAQLALYLRARLVLHAVTLQALPPEYTLSSFFIASPR